MMFYLTHGTIAAIGMDYCHWILSLLCHRIAGASISELLFKALCNPKSC